MIDTKACKQAIVKFVVDHPGHVSSQFCDDQYDEALAAGVGNWARITKRRPYEDEVARWPGASSVREFDCRPFDDQLRATVVDDGTRILSVSITGE